MVSIMATTAVIFDFFGTLTPSTPTEVWDAHAARSAAPLGIPARQWRTTLDVSFAERATGSLGDPAATFRTLAQRNTIDPSAEALAAACTARMAAQQELFVLRDDAVPTLTELRSRGLRLGVLSDCSAVTGATNCGMRAFMLRADDWGVNDAHAREDDWTGPALPSLTDVMSLTPL
jgi:putative hydrolase of the HAD superfamily